MALSPITNARHAQTTNSLGCSDIFPVRNIYISCLNWQHSPLSSSALLLPLFGKRFLQVTSARQTWCSGQSNDQSRLSADRWVCTSLSLQVFRTVLVHRQRQAKVFSLSDTHTGKKLAYYCKNTLNSSSWDNMTDFFFYLCFELSKGSKIFNSSVSKSKTWWILYTWLILEHRFFQISSFFL